ncbi:MAG: DNA topoisomerase IB [Actinomycetota bacterium]|nr:DNA topoisomerase IB [Actinomycetota bacterium]
MPRLRTVSPNSPGWTRRRAGKGFVYLDEDGNRLSTDAALRCKQLVIPPAWTEVWVCPVENGHIQAVGTDDAGRRQYIYHRRWRELRDKSKHDRVLKVAARLPEARRTVARHLALDGMPRERALAAAFRLLDLGFFRIGGESYAEQNGSYGLATIEKQHVRIEGGSVVFEYKAKSGKERLIALADQPVRDAIEILRRRRGGGPELLAYQESRRWRDVTSTDINGYVKEVVGDDVSAKDFRTWHGTVLAAVALAAENDKSASKAARKRAVAKAMREVAEYLGNTPTVARASYVDPRVVDLFEDGITISPALRVVRENISLGDGATHGRIEQAVLDLLETPPAALLRAARRRSGRVRRRSPASLAGARLEPVAATG